MLDSDTPAESTTGPETGETPAGETPVGETPAKKTAKRAPAKKAAAKKTAAKKTAAKKTTTKKAAAKKTVAPVDPDQPTLPDTDEVPAEAATDEAAAVESVEAPAAAKATAKKAAKKTAAKRTAAKKTTAKKTAAPATADTDAEDETAEAVQTEAAQGEAQGEAEADETGATAAPAFVAPVFQAPDVTKAAPRRRRSAAKKTAEATASETLEDETTLGASDDETQATPAEVAADTSGEDEGATEGTDEGSEDGDEQGGARRRRRRGGRRRRKGSGSGSDGSQQDDGSESDSDDDQQDRKGGDESEGENGGGSATSRRRRRRRRAGEDGDNGGDDPENTVTRVRKARSPEDEITALSGSTRLEAKKQRRREGREAGRRRAPIVSEAEFLARREAVDRVMVIRQREDLTQIAVLEDKVLVEHYVARESQTSLIGNVYLGKVQNVLPSMEAAFIDIGKGRNAVLYAGEVNWDALGAGNGPRKIEQVLKSGQSVLVQVTKDPIGHKGARLTSQISLPGRFLVYVPDGTTSGISRKLPDTERNRLKSLLKEIVPDSAGVIVRTAAEGASEDELTRDVERLTARWEDIAGKVEKGNAPQLLYGEPDLTLKVVRDLFTEDFGKLVVSGDDAWDMVESYVEHVAPDLADRLERYDGREDAFAAYRIDEQIAKALDRKVWLPSGGSLIIDRTEAMTVVDVNTGKFTGSGGNLEETVTKNNLEAAEEIVRQLRLRDIGGIIVVDFIDMVLESNRDLVLRRMVECLGRDRTRHQVAEVTSLGLVQMTRKRIGTGLLEAFSETCEHCQGRGLLVHHEPVEPKRKAEDEQPRRSRRGRNRGKGEGDADHGPEQGHGERQRVPVAEGLRGDGRQAGRARSRRRGEARGREARGREPAAARPRRRRSPRPSRPRSPRRPPARTRPSSRSPQAGRGEARRRRRGARKAAGSPTPTTEQPAAEKPEASAPAPVTDAGADRRDRAPETAPEAPPAAPAAPVVVTSSRRRSARRPAGPPPGAEQGSVLTPRRVRRRRSGRCGRGRGRGRAARPGEEEGLTQALSRTGPRLVLTGPVVLRKLDPRRALCVSSACVQHRSAHPGRKRDAQH